jgi:hypothetical protein
MRRLELLFGVYRLIARVSRRAESAEFKVRGNDKYSIWLILRIYFALRWLHWTPNLFYEKLKLHPLLLRRLFRLPNALPSRSQFFKRVRTPEFLKAERLIHEASAVEGLRLGGWEEEKTALIDLSPIPSAKTDHHARRGVRETKNGRRIYFYGYKFGTVCTISGLTLSATLIRANKIEASRGVSLPLLRSAGSVLKKAKTRLDYLLGDAQFAKEPIHRAVHRHLKCRLLAPPEKKKPGKRYDRTRYRWKRQTKSRSPHRYRDWLFWKTPTAHRIHEKRREIEHRISQWKDYPFVVDRRPRCAVGVDRLLRHQLCMMVFWNLAVNENIRNGRKTARVKVYVA